MSTPRAPKVTLTYTAEGQYRIDKIQGALTVFDGRDQSKEYRAGATLDEKDAKSLYAEVTVVPFQA